MTDTVEAPAEEAAVTAEIVATSEDETPALAEADARALTDQIKAAGQSVWDLIIRAHTGKVWESLGYADWDSYVDAEFDAEMLALPRESRKDRVCSLRDAGIPIRAIAKATNSAVSTVSEDLRQAGKTSRNRNQGRKKSEVIDAEVVDDDALTIGRPSQNVSEFAGNMVGFGTIALGAAKLDSDVVLFIDGVQRVIRAQQARNLAGCLLMSAELADQQA